jgi:hypothetical protein
MRADDMLFIRNLVRLFNAKRMGWESNTKWELFFRSKIVERQTLIMVYMINVYLCQWAVKKCGFSWL